MWNGDGNTSIIKGIEEAREKWQPDGNHEGLKKIKQE